MSPARSPEATDQRLRAVLWGVIDTTGEVVGSLSADFVGEPPSGWWLRLRGPKVVIGSAYRGNTGAHDPDATAEELGVRVDVWVTDARLAQRLRNPIVEVAVFDGLGRGEDAEAAVRFKPKPARLTVRLTDGGRGPEEEIPVVGGTVWAVPENGDAASVPLRELADPRGTYMSYERLWPSEFSLYSLRLRPADHPAICDGHAVDDRVRCMDPVGPETYVHVRPEIPDHH